MKTKFPTYVDIHYIILSTILETIYHKPFAGILEEKIFSPLDLKHTTINPIGDNIASNNYEIKKEEEVDFITPGLIHDTKGRVAAKLGITTGHASIFTTGKDLLKFLKSFLERSLLKKETIEKMLSHQDRNKENLELLKQVVQEEEINKMYENAKKINPEIKVMRTYNNMGTRYQNAIKKLNDVPCVCSKNTIACSYNITF